MSDVIDVNQKPTNLYEAGLIIGALKSQLREAELLAKSLQIKLQTRKTIEQKERNLFPHWLLVMELSRKQKWEIYLNFRLTSEADILVNRIRQLGSKIELFALSVQELYDKWSIEYHEIEELEMENDEDDWNQLFKDVGLQIKRQKIGLRIIIEYISSSSVPPSNHAVSSGYVFLGNINWFAENSDITLFCQSQQIVVNNILHLKNERGRQIGTVVLEVDDVHLCSAVFKSVPATNFTAPNKTIEVLSYNLHLDN